MLIYDNCGPRKSFGDDTIATMITLGWGSCSGNEEEGGHERLPMCNENVHGGYYYQGIHRNRRFLCSRLQNGAG